MASFYYLNAVAFLMFCSTTTFAETNSTFQPGKKASTSTACNLHISKSKVEEVLRLQYNTTTNTVRIKVSVVSGNESRYFPEMTWLWASEIGRTVIYLLRRAKYTIFTSPIFTSILEIGIEDLDIQVSEETDGCLPQGDHGSDRIFDFLLHQFSNSKDKPVYKLCRAHKDESTHYATYNCCRIAGDRNLVVCAEYSSVVVKFAVPAVIVVCFISLFLVLPFVLQHITTYRTIDNEFYKTSDSHMSLISIASMLCFAKKSRALSLFRRCLFVGLSSMVFLRDFFGFQWLKILFGVWAAVFVLSYAVPLVQKDSKDKIIDKTKLSEKIISCFTLPFNYPWEKIKCREDSRSEDSSCQWFCKYLMHLFSAVSICILAILYFSIFFPFFVALCLVKFTLIDLLISFVFSPVPSTSFPGSREEPGNEVAVPSGKKWLKRICIYVLLILLYSLKLLTLLNIVFFTAMILNFALFIVVGLSLNAEYFSPFVAPIFTLAVYFWKNWKLSVEAKCLELKTLIIKVCKEKLPPKEDEQNSENHTTNIKAKNKNELTCKNRLFNFLCPCIRDTSKCSQTGRNLKNQYSCCTKSTSQQEMNPDEQNPLIGFSSDFHSTSENNNIAELASRIDDNKDDKLVIKFDKYGEAMISKQLYEKVSKEILSLEHPLFYFFRRVIFVGLYAFVMFTVMILGRDSGVSESVQVISAIAGAMIPFAFDTILADGLSSQMNSKKMATKEKLEHILKVNKRENNIIFVELNDINDDASHKNQQVERREGAINEHSC